jgi:hypothetical protein
VDHVDAGAQQVLGQRPLQRLDASPRRIVERVEAEGAEPIVRAQPHASTGGNELLGHRRLARTGKAEQEDDPRAQ